MTVVAAKDGQIFSSYLPDCAMRHSVLLMSEIDKLLEQAGMTAKDLDFVSAVVGAGSFTGIRIGIATAKGFCLAENKPSLPVTSFQVAAYNAKETEKPLAILDALHGMYYVCGFDEKKEVLDPPAYVAEEEILRLISARGYTPYAFKPLPLASDLKCVLADPVSGLVNAIEALSEREENFAPLTALYIRKSQAEENRA
jgi:tRNA threonylcarbamoyladenosine biosynthesis protein TsaB